ncbi:stemmadenine O-acetyltransferase-like [Malus sylvestris]|uniref:stemmadenine O-acetyltransferase-like n=1 Tax=Malus sylvestris TaxID=3752 RepID=UPI0021AC3EF9|nr:stemmadenine O-acetyltransferase-like [Malus sylvestris]
MKVQVVVISKEIIRPSSPTPGHLRHYQFSFLDQMAPQVYNPLLLFYEYNAKMHPNITEISNHLKNSLSEALSLFYPLAGRIKDNCFIHCNDEGIPYIEARVLNCTLSDVLSNPNPDELNKFMPFELDDITNPLPFGVQLNIFQCGGFAIGQCVSHKIADGLSYFTFSKIWAAIARGEQANIDPPQFVSATLFPPKEFNTGFDGGVGITKDRVTKRFVFNASKIKTLQAKYEKDMKSLQLKHPTRVETLSAFIWSGYVAATKDCTVNKLYMVIHAVNLRPRFSPPLPQHSFGNLFRVAMTSPLRISNGGEEECDGVVIGEVREAISKIDNEYVKQLQGQGDEHLGLMKKAADSFKRGDMVAVLSFSSYCRFPLYENDFGWGKPAWVGSPALTYKNLVLFMDTKEGDGIEAYVSLEERVMVKFECDSELLSYVSPDGRVLLSCGN